MIAKNPFGKKKKMYWVVKNILAVRNDRFFEKKRAWSIVKDDLLGCYLKPYLQKVLHTRHPIMYVDCFAGAGKFDDGTDGSPIIALKILETVIAQSKISNGHIESYFIEFNHSDRLKKNLSDYSNVHVISGKYEDNIRKIITNGVGKNIFLYIDPYGVKELDFNFLSSLANKNFHSIELLLNFNSFGFLRVACAALGVEFKNEYELLDEYDKSLPKRQSLTSTANKVAGGNYWEKIIENYRSGKFDFHEAEKRFVKEYCCHLSNHYDFVLNMHIKSGQLPKYRMIHATNHPDGALLMADNIFKREELLQEIISGGQLSLFKYDMSVDLEKFLVDYIPQFKSFENLNTLLAKFFCIYGIICSSKDIIKILKKLEKQGKILVERNPSKTTTGKLSTSWDTRKIKLKWNT